VAVPLSNARTLRLNICWAAPSLSSGRPAGGRFASHIGKVRGLLDRAGRSLEWRPFPLLSGFLRIGSRGVRLLDDMRMHAVVPNLPNHQNPRQVWALS
jgi:hypothetical protein